jgi:F0F1-type ATP synthase membrane subunit c/vacuolar-type H+-ATPase subunit K
VCIYQFALGHGIPQGQNQDPMSLGIPEIIAIANLSVALFIRWILIPRTRQRKQLLVLMIVGLALSEAVEFFGLFLIPAGQPETKLLFWMLSLLSCLQFAPLYARAEPPASEQFRMQ